MVIALVVATVFAQKAYADVTTQLETKQQETAKTKAQLESTSDKLEQTAAEKAAVEAKLKAEAEKSQKLEKENADLKAKKQARLEALAKATKNSQIRSVAVSGNCSAWLASAGVTDLANAHELIRRESGCNPNAVNPSSGACGVAQELPCGKSGCSLGDGACQVAWMDRYVKARYGSWAGAIAHSNAVGWY